MPQYNPDTNCPREAEIRAEIARLNYAGNWREVTAGYIALTAHRRTCPTCQGVPLAEQFFGKKVEVIA